MEENNNVLQNDTIVNDQNNNASEPSFENNKGSKKGLLIIIAILVLIIAGLLFYLFVIKSDDKDKNKNSDSNNTNNIQNSNNNNNSNNTNSNINENRELSKKEISDLISIIDTYALDSLIAYENGKIMEINNKMILNALSSKYLNNSDSYISTYDIDDVKAYFKDAFNLTISTFPDVICPIDNEVMYKYVASNNTYTFNEDHPGHGGFNNPIDDHHYIFDSSTDGEYYTIDVIFAYGNLIDGFYVNGKELDLDLVGYNDGDSIEEIHSKVDKYFNNHINDYVDGDIYEYTFKKDGENYYLYSLKTVSNH